jgi:mannitol 2-dehydrogenase
VHEVVGDALFGRYLREFIDREAMPTLAQVPGLAAPAYAAQVVARFANPAVADPLARLAVDGSDRIATFVVPVIKAQLERGGDIWRATLAVAAWARYLEGVDDAGQHIDRLDRRLADIAPLVRRQRADPTALLTRRDVFGDLIESSRFAREYAAALRSLQERGASATLSDRLVTTPG